MSLLAQADFGIKRGPQFNIICGEHSLGKSTLAAQFPKPVFADLENGSKNFNIHRFTPKHLPTFKEYLKLVNEIRHTTDDIASFTTDSLMLIESYIHRHLIGTKYDSIEDYGGGFGKGYTAAREMAMELTDKLKDIVENREIDVNIVAHVEPNKQSDPDDNIEYDRYVLQGNKKFTQVFYAQAYNVYFMKRVIYTELNKNKKTVATFDGQRVICTEWRPGANAKNRLDLPGEIILPKEKDLAYKTLKNAIDNAILTPDGLRTDIEALLKGADKETIQKAKARVTEAGDNIEALKFIKSKVLEVAQASAE